MALVALFAGFGCRGMNSELPPVHLIQNMDQQRRFDPQEPSDLFEDGRSIRPRVEGTVAYGHLEEDDHLYRGRDEDGFVDTLPPSDDKGQNIALNRDFLVRGQRRYQIYCTPCHDSAGGGNGVVVQHGMPQPPSFHDERIMAMPVGQFYDIITHGVRNMPPYKPQIQLRDRWAIATYVRTLQLSRNARLEDIPADEAAARRWEIR
jgi:hypothetical protein